MGAHGSLVESFGGVRLSADYYVSTKLLQMFYTSVKFIVMRSGLRTMNSYIDYSHINLVTFSFQYGTRPAWQLIFFFFSI